MSVKSIAVLGAGNTGLAIAAKLALEGHEVILWDTPSHAASLEPLMERREVRLTGTSVVGTATLADVTTDVQATLESADVLIAAVPSYAHAAFATLLAPHLQQRHLLALLPGNLGTLEFAEHLRRAPHAAGQPLLVEGDTAPYVCRRLGPDHAHIFGVVTSIGLGALAATDTDRALATLEPLFPGLRAYPHVIAAGLGALNPVVHPAGMLMNAGRIEYSQGDFRFYEEGVTPTVARMIEALDDERRAIGSAMGFELLPVAEGFLDLWIRPGRRLVGDDQRQPHADPDACSGLTREPLAERGRPLRTAHMGRAR